MICINAHINQVSDFDDFETDILIKDLELLGIDDFINVGEVPYLLNALEVNKYQDSIILFTNFSPNHFFKYRGIDVSKFGIKPIPNWHIKQYSFSAALYNHICKEYPITEIHFVTSALGRVVNDIDFLSLTEGIHTTLKRKGDWYNSEIPYNVLLKKHILDCLYRFVKSNNILVPNSPKTLLQNLMVNYCQN
ncbi:hypothetical protein [uncultured Draconibacterium sp.]|uniref:hypothetical protein n=1 Tax=uncultured Draconibacterium sp. TaxID=1573823 RepID=UPI0025D5991D|nr:hypothetical protein [uncultured Draconibacterium sp.]